MLNESGTRAPCASRARLLLDTEDRAQNDSERAPGRFSEEGMAGIAVIDIGKTNAKLLVVDPSKGIEEIVARVPNRVHSTIPYPHFDTEGLGRVGAVDAVTVTKHAEGANRTSSVPCSKPSRNASEDSGTTGFHPSRSGFAASVFRLP